MPGFRPNWPPGRPRMMFHPRRALYRNRFILYLAFRNRCGFPNPVT